jgi:hypothetical protein
MRCGSEVRSRFSRAPVVPLRANLGWGEFPGVNPGLSFLWPLRATDRNVYFSVTFFSIPRLQLLSLTKPISRLTRICSSECAAVVKAIVEIACPRRNYPARKKEAKALLSAESAK